MWLVWCLCLLMEWSMGNSQRSIVNRGTPLLISPETSSGQAPQVENSSSLVVMPTAGGQTVFLSRWEYECVFGGETGPGKTWALVIDALGGSYKTTMLGKAAYEVSEYRAALFRRKTTELNKLIDEARKYYSAFGAVYVSRRQGDPGPSFTFPSGARIFMCHLENENNVHDHDGIEYQYVGFDELTHFSIRQYLYLHSRLRSKVPNLFTRVRATAMPVGVHLQWVKKRFITGMEAMTTCYFIADERPEENPLGIQVSAQHPDGRSRMFVPGHLQENSFINQNEYRANVKQLGKRYEKAMLEHDWDAFGGDFFKEFDRGKEVIKPFEIPKHWYLVGSIDVGFSSPFSFGLTAQSPEGEYFRVATYYYALKNPEQNAQGVKRFIEACKWTNGRMPDVIVAGVDAWAKRSQYAVQATDKTVADVFQAEGMILQMAQTDRVPGWWAVRSLMPDRFFVFKDLNQPLLDEMAAAVADERDPEDILGKGNDPNVSDHALDELRYGIMASYKPAKPKGKGMSWQERLLKGSKSGGGWKAGMG